MNIKPKTWHRVLYKHLEIPFWFLKITECHLSCMIWKRKIKHRLGKKCVIFEVFVLCSSQLISFLETMNEIYIKNYSLKRRQTLKIMLHFLYLSNKKFFKGAFCTLNSINIWKKKIEFTKDLTFFKAIN